MFLSLAVKNNMCLDEKRKTRWLKYSTIILPMFVDTPGTDTNGHNMYFTNTHAKEMGDSLCS